ncbi:plasmid partitioning protein RepA [Acuticoccus yangtzensis]|uniref:plasmid partitioning protein RepA n=1 Tax=Acuticoccus yangtzensis TaxID=1443441 RepID=UPI00094991AD|nr:plasmid partitioning protein RepA [Acuticoccus yangtzensis]
MTGAAGTFTGSGLHAGGPVGFATIAGDAATLSAQIARLRAQIFQPDLTKTLRPFTSQEAAKLLGVTDSYLRHMARGGEGPEPSRLPGNRHAYSLSQVEELRTYLARKGGAKSRVILPGRPAGEPAQIVAVANFKGGSGKTTTTVHLAQHLAMRGFRVLAVDLDPQASLSSLFGYQPEADVSSGETLYGAIRYDAPRPVEEVIRRTYFPNLDLVPGNLELHEFEHETPRALMERGTREIPFYSRVATALRSVQMDYDVVLIDCPPQLGFLTLGALCAASGVLVTVHPQMLDIASMSQFLNMTADLMDVVRRAGANVELDFFRYVLTRYEPKDGPQAQVAGFLRSLFGERVLTNAMVKSTALADAGLSKQTLYEVGREGMTRSTYDRALESLDAVNGEIEGLIRAVWEERRAPAEAAE